jgi:hypothetical protein
MVKSQKKKKERKIKLLLRLKSLEAVTTKI